MAIAPCYWRPWCNELAAGEPQDADFVVIVHASNAHWSSLMAPGVYVAFAFKNSPFRVGIAASKTPELRSVDFGGGVTKNADSTRVLCF